MDEDHMKPADRPAGRPLLMVKTHGCGSVLSLLSETPYRSTKDMGLQLASLELEIWGSDEMHRSEADAEIRRFLEGVSTQTGRPSIRHC